MTILWQSVISVLSRKATMNIGSMGYDVEMISLILTFIGLVNMLA